MSRGYIIIVRAPPRIKSWKLIYPARYWKDPKHFEPERFLEDWNRDAFLPFSTGASMPLADFSSLSAIQGPEVVSVEGECPLACEILPNDLQVQRDGSHCSHYDANLTLRG